MKNIHQVLVILSFITIATPFQSALYAQQNAIKFNLAAVGQLTFDYERAYDSKNTVVAELQRWSQTKQKSSSLPLFGIVASDDTKTKTTGYRMSFMARHYRKKAMNSGFIEGGFYFGKHDITITHTSSTFNPWAILFLDLDNIDKSSTSTKTYKDVKVGGGRIGGGYQKTIKMFAFEFSGGLNINAYNSSNARPTLPFKGASPYARVKCGLAF